MSISILIFYDGCCLDLPEWSTCHLRLKLQKFPSLRWENALLTCPTRLSWFDWDPFLFFQGWVRASLACKIPIAPMGKLLTGLPRLSLAQLRPTLRSTTASTCRRDLQLSHRPHGRLTLCSLFAGWWCLCRERHSVNREFPDLLQHSYRCARSSSKVPIAPMGSSQFARCLQGGGVYVYSGTVTITSSSIYGNTAGYVRAHVQKFPIAPLGKLLTRLPRLSHAKLRTAINYRMYVPQRSESSHRPDGKVADVLAPTHACIIGNASVNYRGCVPQRPSMFPSPRWEHC
jgi:hypothetical protein